MKKKIIAAVLVSSLVLVSIASANWGHSVSSRSIGHDRQASSIHPTNHGGHMGQGCY
jgi:hypothetical protein